MKGPVRRFWRARLQEEASSGSLDWEKVVDSPEFWARLADPKFISDEEIWALRYRLRRELIEFARRRLLIQTQRLTHGDFIAFDHLLNPDALTIGFARRFDLQKRAPLIFQQLENIVKLTRNKNQPVQFIFAGKAHPRDDDGKRYIQHIIHLGKYSDLQGHLVFIENYDMHVARQMVSGCDVWLNTPRRPLEASGTSGMKGGCHGCLNFSILDGWWREGYDGGNGFAIGEDAHADSVEEQDRADSANLYKVLTSEVIPLFYQRDTQGCAPMDSRIRHAMATLVPQYTTSRMVREHMESTICPGRSPSDHSVE
jgi:starch phosphorylase